MIHVCMICLYMCPCYGTCVWVKEQHWVLVPIFCCVWDIVSFLVCQCMLHASWSCGYAESLVSASHRRGSAGVIDPLHQIQLCVIMGIWTQDPHLHSKHSTCSAIFPPRDWPFVSSFDKSQRVVRDQLYNGG